MDVAALAQTAVRRRVARAGRRFKGEAIREQIDAAGRPSSEHSSFNYPTGSSKSAEAILRLLGLSCGEEEQ